jgi:hypothetical protein
MVQAMVIRYCFHCCSRDRKAGMGLDGPKYSGCTVLLLRGVIRTMSFSCVFLGTTARALRNVLDQQMFNLCKAISQCPVRC